MHHLPNLDFLRAFVAAADAKTIKGAAFDLDISPSAVSQAIAKLEGQIGQPVFVKHARPLRLTPVGARLLEQISRAFPIHVEHMGGVKRDRRS